MWCLEAYRHAAVPVSIEEDEIKQLFVDKLFLEPLHPMGRCFWTQETSTELWEKIVMQSWDAAVAQEFRDEKEHFSRDLQRAHSGATV